MAATTSALLLGLAGIAGAGSGALLAGKKGPAMPTPIAAPTAPVTDPAGDAAFARAQAVTARKRASGAPGIGSTLLTGAQGVTQPAPVAFKTLLGQ